MTKQDNNNKKRGRPKLPYKSVRFNLHWPQHVGEWFKAKKENKKIIIDFVNNIIKNNYE